MKAESKAGPRATPGGTVPHQGNSAGGKNPLPEFMQIRE